MNNRFLKNNFCLLAAVSVCLLVALGLLIFTLVEYVQMYGYITKIEDFRSEIGRIIRQRPAPVEGNKQLLQQDIDLYRKVAEELHKQFGHPMQPALDRFFSVLRVRKGAFGEDVPEELTQERFMELFRRDWNSIDKNDYPRQKYFLNYEFEPKFANWHKAQGEFIKEAQRYTLEPLTTDNADEVLFGALGIPRRLTGDGGRMTRLINEVREQLLKELGDRIQLALGASGLGLGVVSTGERQDGGTPSFVTEEFPIVLEHLDIVTDMLRRIKDSGVKTVYDVRIRRGGEAKGKNDSDAVNSFAESVEQAGDYRRYHYQMEVSGSMESIRNMVKLLDGACADRRVYVVRMISLYAEENGAAGLFASGIEDDTESAERSGKQTQRRRRRSRRSNFSGDELQRSSDEAELERRRKQEAALRRYQEQQARLPYERRDGYGEVLIGSGEMFRAVIDVEYVAFVGRQ